MRRLTHSTPRGVRLTVTALVVLTALAAALGAAGLRWQHSASLPRGLYRLHGDAPIRRGSIVLWCLDAARGQWAHRRGYLARGDCPGAVEPLGKVVLGVAGDTIDWTPEGLRVRGHFVARTDPVRSDGAGRPLTPIPFGRYVLGRDALWLYSPYTRRSLDSRYVGAVPRTWVRAVVTPIMTRVVP